MFFFGAFWSVAFRFWICVLCKNSIIHTVWFVSRSDWEGCWCCRFCSHFHHGSQDQNDSGKSFHQQNLGNLQVLIHADGATEWSLRCIRKRVQRHWLGCELNPVHNSYVAQCSMFVNPGWRLGLCEILWVLWWITSIRRVCLATHSPPKLPP